MSIHLNQQSYLARRLCHAIVGLESEQAFSICEGIDDKKYKYLLALYFNNKIEKLKSEVDELMKGKKNV